MTTKHEVIALHRKRPDWSSVRIADELNCDPAYVRATFYRNGLRFAERHNAAARRRLLVSLGEAAERAGLTLEKLQARARS